MDLHELEEMAMENIEYLNDIKNGKIPSWRMEKFEKGGNAQVLRLGWIGDLFTDDQFNRIGNFVDEVFGDKELVLFVLLPEILIRIYQIVVGVKTSKEAERMLKNAGSLPDADYNDDLGLF